MSIVNNIAAGSSASRVEVFAAPRSRASSTPAETATTPTRESDTVNLSEQARYLDALRENKDVRVDLVQRIRAEIAAGTYESFDKFDKAVDGLIEDLTQ
jgi:flagellar biosynthesis anti-sigma factor FlgM